MGKCILNGSQQVQWMIGGKFLPGSVPVDLTEEEMTKHADIINSTIENGIIIPVNKSQLSPIAEKIKKTKKVTKK